MRLKFALFLLAVVVFSLIGEFVFLYRSGLVDKLINGSRFNFSAASEHPDYNLKINNKENLEKAFSLLGYSYGRHIKGKGLKKSDLHGIKFILTNSPQPAYAVTAPEGRVLKSAGFGFDPKRQELLVYVHFSDETLREIINNDRGAVDATILDYLCIGADGFKGADSMDNCAVIGESTLNLYGGKTNLFSLEKKKKLSFKIVKEVYAGCTGSYTCCVATSVCTCSSGGGSCTRKGWPCDNYRGVCSCTTRNVVRETNDCVGGGGSCGYQSPSCSTGAWFPCGGNSCQWVTPTPPPTCSNCGTYPNCYNPYCSGSCAYGCSSINCSGGVCNPAPTPPPPTPTPPPTPPSCSCGSWSNRAC